MARLKPESGSWGTKLLRVGSIWNGPSPPPCCTGTTEVMFAIGGGGAPAMTDSDTELSPSSRIVPMA